MNAALQRPFHKPTGDDDVNSVHIAGSVEFHRFSGSPIWQQQRDFFKSQGVDAERLNIVPHYVTSPPMMAHTYIEMLFAFWLDNQLNETLNPDEPLYIVELGAGSGVLSHALLTQLFERLPLSPFKHLKPILIVTDLVQANLDFARSHFKLAPYVASRQVDFALLDAEWFSEIPLQHSGITLSHQNLRNPLAVIANCVFDSLTQDLICVHHGKVFEGFLGLTNIANENPLLQSPIYDWRPLVESKRYPEQLLNYYLRNINSNPILIPTGAINSIDHSRALSALPLMVLSADRGVSHLSQLRQQSEPEFPRHGSFSLPVNYHALGLLAKSAGAKAHVYQHQDDGLALSTLVYGRPLTGDRFPHTQQAFNRSIEEFNSNDAYLLTRTMETLGHQLTPEQMLAQLRLSRWDYRILDLFFPSLLQQLYYLAPNKRSHWKQAIQHIWQRYYPLGDTVEPCYQIGILAAALGIWGLSNTCFRAGIELHHHLKISLFDQGIFYFNLALCCLQLGEFNLAEGYIKQALSFATRLSASSAKVVTKTDLNLTSHNYDNINESNQTFQQQCHRLMANIVLHKQQPDWYDRVTFSDAILCLQPIASYHAAEILIQLRDPSIANMVQLPELNSQETTELWIADCSKEAEGDKPCRNITLAIIHPQFGFIGSVALHCVAGSAFFYFWIGTDYQGQGFAGRAASLLVKAAKKRLHIKRFFTTVYQHNYRSLKVLTEIGWRYLPFTAKTKSKCEAGLDDEDIQCLVYGDEPIRKNLRFLKNELQALLIATESDLYLLENETTSFQRTAAC